jgi:hypothetical protein
LLLSQHIDVLGDNLADGLRKNSVKQRQNSGTAFAVSPSINRKGPRNSGTNEMPMADNALQKTAKTADSAMRRTVTVG